MSKTFSERLIAACLPLRIFIASHASYDAITLTIGPRIPAVSQVGVVPGGGASRIKHLKQAVSPGKIVIVWPSAPMHPP